MDPSWKFTKNFVRVWNWTGLFFAGVFLGGGSLYTKPYPYSLYRCWGYLHFRYRTKSLDSWVVLCTIGHMGVSKKRGFPQIIHFNRFFFHYFHPYFWFNTHILCDRRHGCSWNPLRPNSAADGWHWQHCSPWRKAQERGKLADAFAKTRDYIHSINSINIYIIYYIILYYIILYYIIYIYYIILYYIILYYIIFYYIMYIYYIIYIHDVSMIYYAYNIYIYITICYLLSHIYIYIFVSYNIIDVMTRILCVSISFL